MQNKDEIKNIPTPTKEEIQKNYVTPGHPIAFSSPALIYQYYNKKISYKKIREYLSYLDAYTLHRETKKVSFPNHYITLKARDLLQMDLIDMRELRTHNGGYSYILCIIDVHTKFLWAFLLFKKSAEEIKKTLKKWFYQVHLPKNQRILFGVDKGTEFWNKEVKNLMKEKNVHMYVDHGLSKAAVVERCQKTLQIMIYKYLTHFETFNYANVLDDIVKSYNNKPHRTLQNFTPKEAELKKNEATIRGIHLLRHAKLLNKKKKPIFSLGTVVRISIFAQRPSPAARAYAQQFHGEYFRIVRINKTLPVPLYYLISLNNGDFIPQGFYKEELQPVYGDVYKIEKILKTKKRGRKKYHLVRWKYFDLPVHDSWIDAKDITQTY